VGRLPLVRLAIMAPRRLVASHARTLACLRRRTVQSFRDRLVEAFQEAQPRVRRELPSEQPRVNAGRFAFIGLDVLAPPLLLPSPRRGRGAGGDGARPGCLPSPRGGRGAGGEGALRHFAEIRLELAEVDADERR